MIDVSIILSILSVVSICSAIAFSYIAMRRNNNIDTEERASMNARVLTKLDTISDDLREMKRESQDLRQEVGHLNERVIILEQRIKPNV